MNEGTPSGPTWTTKKASRFGGKGKWIALIAAILVLSTVAGLSIWVITRNTTPSTSQDTASEDMGNWTGKVCSDEVIRSGEAAVAASDIEAMTPIYETIIKQEHYDHDMNCQYLVARYALIVGDYVLVERQIKAIISSQQNGHAYSSTFDLDPMPVRDMQTALATAKQQGSENADLQNMNDQLDAAYEESYVAPQ